MKKLILTFTILVLVLLPLSAMADTPIGLGDSHTFVADQTIGGYEYKAEATFSVDASGDLTIFLTNTAPIAPAIPAEILHAVFWNSETFTSLPLSGATAKISTGSLAEQFNTLFTYSAGTNVGGEFAYASGIFGPNGTSQGISSAGYGLFGNGNLGGSNITNTVAVGGIDWGIVNSTFVFGSGNTPMQDNPLIKTSATFTFDTNFTSPILIDDVTFQYGTALTDNHITAPIPGSLLLLGSGILGLVGFRKKL